MIIAANVVICVLVTVLVVAGSVSLFSRREDSAVKFVAPTLAAPGRIVTVTEYERDREAVEDYFVGVREHQRTTRRAFNREFSIETNVVPIERRRSIRQRS